jgi:hypothetical protein
VPPAGGSRAAKSCTVSGPIDPLPHSTPVERMHCKDRWDYLSRDCFLAPMSVLAAHGSERFALRTSDEAALYDGGRSIWRPLTQKWSLM